MLEANIYALWGGKQAAKGTPNTAPGKRFNQVGGEFAVNREDGEENFSDLTKYGDRSDWVNSLTAQGEPAIEATPTELAWLLWMFHGAETVTAVTGPPASSKHRFVPQLGRGHWGTFVTRLGQSIIRRRQNNDCLIGRVQIEGSTANKAVRVTPRILSLDPDEVIAADPAAGMPVDNPFIYTDGAGTFTVDGVAIEAHSQFTLVIDEDLTPVYGDDAVPHDLVQGNAVVTIGITLLMDTEANAELNKLLYGTATPATGTKPLRTVPALGSYAFSLKQRDGTGALNGRQFDLTIPGVKWPVPDAPGPNPDGGSTELALAGAMRPVSGQQPYTIDVYTDPAVVAFTA